MARHQIRAAKPKPEKPKAELRAAPSWYDRTHPVGSAERFLDQAAKEALVAAAAGGLAEPRQLAAGAVKAVAKKASEYPDPLLQRAAELPAAELAKRAARAEAYNQAMQAQNRVAEIVSASLSPVSGIARTQAAAALSTQQDWNGGKNTVSRVNVADTTRAERVRRQEIDDEIREARRPRIGGVSDLELAMRAEADERLRLSTGPWSLFSIPKEKWDKLGQLEKERLAEISKDALETGAAYATGMILKAPRGAVSAAEKILENAGVESWAKAPRKLKLDIKRQLGVEQYQGRWVKEAPDPTLSKTTKAFLEEKPQTLYAPGKHGAVEDLMTVPKELSRKVDGTITFSRGASRDGILGEYEPMSRSILVNTRDPKSLAYRTASEVEGTTVHEIQHQLDARAGSGLGIKTAASPSVEARLGPYVGTPTETRAFNVEYRHRFMTPEQRAGSLLEDTTERIFLERPEYRGALGGPKRSTLASDLFRQDAKGGRTVRAAQGSQQAEPPVDAEVPAEPSPGPRIVINPTTFRNSKDALCVAFNEGFRLWMEANDFEPQSEPTDAQRKFFSDTAYADDEVQLRRTILARIATFDTSVKDPTDDQLSETASFLNAVLESDWCRNDWERNSVQKLARAVEASVGAEPVEPKAEPVEPRAEAPLEARAALGGGETDEDNPVAPKPVEPPQDTSGGEDLETPDPEKEAFLADAPFDANGNRIGRTGAGDASGAEQYTSYEQQRAEDTGGSLSGDIPEQTAVADNGSPTQAGPEKAAPAEPPAEPVQVVEDKPSRLRMNGPAIQPTRRIGDIGATSFTDTKHMNGPSIQPARKIGDVGATSFTDTKSMNGPSIEPARPIGDVGATSFTDDGMNGPSIEPVRPIGTIDTTDGSGGSTLRRKKRRRSRT